MPLYCEAASWGSFQDLEVGPHDRINPTGLSCAPEIFQRSARAPILFERFQGDVQPDLVSILEAVCDGLGERGDPDRHTLYTMLLDPKGKGSSRESHDTKRRRIHPGFPRFDVDR